MIGDRSQITYLELSELLDNDETFAQEALAVLARDYARPKSTYTAATSATALLEKWVQRGELRCYNERGDVVTDFNPTLYRGDDDWRVALESVESSWLIDRASFVQLVDRYRMTIPEAVAYKPGPDSTLLPNAFGYTIDGAAHALSKQCGANEDKWRERILTAARNGELRVRDPQDGAYIKPERVCAWIERVAIADLNAWLETTGTGFKLSVAVAEDMRSPARKEASWHSEARRVADDLDSVDESQGAYDSLENMAERVAVMLRAQGIHGPRGPLSGGTVLREALQAGRWKRAKRLK